MMAIEQPVADTPEETAKPGSEEKGAPDDLDTLLAQFDEEAKPSKPTEEPLKEEPKTDPRVDKLLFNMGKQEALKHMRGDLPDTFDDAIFGYAEGLAARDPRIASAWANRDNRPAEFAQVMKGIGDQYRKLLDALPDKGATEDRSAVTSAVQSASRRAADPEDGPSDADIAAMSDQEFFALKRKIRKSSQG